MPTVRRSVAGLAVVVLLVGLGGPAHAAHRGDPPVTETDRAGDVRGNDRALAATLATRREARSADWTRVTYRREVHDGEPSARVEVVFTRLARPRPGAYYQVVETYVDQYGVLTTRVDLGTARYDDDGVLDREPGCRRPDTTITRTRVVTWVPVRCLPDLDAEMTTSSTVHGLDTDGRGARAVGRDLGSSDRQVFVDWR